MGADLCVTHLKTWYFGFVIQYQNIMDNANGQYRHVIYRWKALDLTKMNHMIAKIRVPLILG